MTILRRLGQELSDFWRTAVVVHELAARSAFRGPVTAGNVGAHRADKMPTHPAGHGPKAT